MTLEQLAQLLSRFRETILSAQALHARSEPVGEGQQDSPQQQRQQVLCALTSGEAAPISLGVDRLTHPIYLQLSPDRGVHLSMETPWTQWTVSPWSPAGDVIEVRGAQGRGQTSRFGAIEMPSLDEGKRLLKEELQRLRMKLAMFEQEVELLNGKLAKSELEVELLKTELVVVQTELTELKGVRSARNKRGAIRKVAIAVSYTHLRAHET